MNARRRIWASQNLRAREEGKGGWTPTLVPQFRWRGSGVGGNPPYLLLLFFVPRKPWIRWRLRLRFVDDTTQKRSSGTHWCHVPEIASKGEGEKIACWPRRSIFFDSFISNKSNVDSIISLSFIIIYCHYYYLLSFIIFIDLFIIIFDYFPSPPQPLSLRDPSSTWEIGLAVGGKKTKRIPNRILARQLFSDDGLNLKTQNCLKIMPSCILREQTQKNWSWQRTFLIMEAVTGAMPAEDARRHRGSWGRRGHSEEGANRWVHLRMRASFSRLRRFELPHEMEEIETE